MNEQAIEETERDVAALAERLDRHPNWAFLDPCPGHGPSLLAAQPRLVLEGGDREPLERELKTCWRGKHGCQGAAIGWFGFDGTWRFGFFDAVQRLGSRHLPKRCPMGHGNLPRQGVAFSPRIDKSRYIAMVQRAKEYITAGDIYQVCLAYPFECPSPTASAWHLYKSLRVASPAPHGAFLRLGDTEILSASPETFLRMEGRAITTRPIKGTRPRFGDPARDRDSAKALFCSTKEQAELLMITDLERNDLGKVCEYGSVHVRELATVEQFEQVFHLVSTVDGTLRSNVSHLDALLACFPGGSISGAPKKRALEIIRELEPFSRGIYTGAIGYFGYSGESLFSIAIRTIIKSGAGLLSFHVGAGIVADSDPVAEWEETLHKAEGMLLAARQLKG